MAPSSSPSPDREADFVVVGGGSAGCIVAAVLAGAGHEVLLLEAGDRAEDHPETLSANGYKKAFVNDALMHERFTIAQPGCNGRSLFAGTGRGVGGSGAINAMVYTRGAREDLDAWGPGWRWQDVAGDFAELEARLRPNRREATEFTRACIAAAGENGIREKADLNDGDLGDVLGHEWMNYEGDRRRNAYVAFIKDDPPRTLTIEAGASATRVELGADGRASLVHFVQGGAARVARARREIVLSAGALETPALLLRSGIGPALELRALGRGVVRDLPGVGRNLHDHPNATLFFLARRPVDCFHPQLYGFTRTRPGRGASDCCLVFYPARSSFREGLLRMLPAMALPEGLYREGTAVRAMRGALSAALAPRPVQGLIERMWGIVVILGKPKSRGTVRLGAVTSGDNTRIDPQYLAHPDDLDAMVSAVKKARAIAASGPLAALGARELIPGPLGGEPDDSDAIARFLRQNLMTTYHFAGTCRLGDDPDSVVDRRLRVRGVPGLRVVDASAVPETPVSAMNAPSMLVGLRGAKMIVEDSRSG
ncbi:MAG: GMC family oxidoreductase [Polyangiaceae bacterium]|jgi:choline dehydrogenase|nr:GMC family oxidoreductase [Polyangiaceae bacterium]MBK8940530.1 GMC family oxidoreductase [Polyangiaceae bacterium]